jgi:hypothetical protein
MRRMSPEIAMCKLNDKGLTPEQIIDIGVRAKTRKVWRKIIRVLNLNKLPNSRVIDLCFRSKDEYFQTRMNYTAKK